MSDFFEHRVKSFILKNTGAKDVVGTETLQILWSDYGEITRYTLEEGQADSVILKNISPPDNSRHPRGWNTQRSHQRKLRSYQIECYWYQHWAERCRKKSPLPRCLGVEPGVELGVEPSVETSNGSYLLLLEDLDASGYSERRSEPSLKELKHCLSWLAEFHAQHLGLAPNGLWPTGTYWHLDTRPDELAAQADGPLKEAAKTIDQALSSAHYQTIVHGDAKVANFCFAKQGSAVAAVDFQYVGGGCGIKDVAYLMGSCLDEERCEALEDYCLQFYFSELCTAINNNRNVSVNCNRLEQEWRQLYPLAWADFARFLSGWMPNHHKLNRYTEKMVALALASL